MNLFIMHHMVLFLVPCITDPTGLRAFRSRGSFIFFRQNLFFLFFFTFLMMLLQADFALHGVKTNKNGGLYKPGHAFHVTRKLQVVDSYLKLCNDSKTGKVTSRKLAEVAQVGETLAQKIISQREIVEVNGLQRIMVVPDTIPRDDNHKGNK